MDMIAWAEQEVRIACEREKPDRETGEWDYGCACYESALKAYKSLAEDGHSGMSISITRQILNLLLLGKPLTPVEDTPDIWKKCEFASEDGAEVYQCTRLSSLFKDVYPDGRVEYKDLGNCVGVDINDDRNRWHNSLVSKIAHELFPVTMPYVPSEKPIEVYCEDFLTDPKNGDYDTIGIMYAKDETGKETPIYRYFRDGRNGEVEISKKEYTRRKQQAKERENENT